jgi:hypothetical protein
LVKGKGQAKGESQQEQDFKLDALYAFSPALEAKLQATLQRFDNLERGMLKAMHKCRKNTVNWNICGLWAAIFKNEKESYQTLADLLRIQFFLFEKSEKQVDALTHKKFDKLTRRLLRKITKREEETKRRWISRNLGVRKNERRE